METIIFSHPNPKSYNGAIQEALIQRLNKEKKTYNQIDLYADHFNPVLTLDELAIYNQGKYLDPLVGKYQSMIAKTTKLYFIFPIWGGTIPAILKGFFDKVFLKDFAFSYQNGWTPLLDIPLAYIITTSESQTSACHNAIQKNFKELMLAPIGIAQTKWLNSEQTTTKTIEQRQAFLKQVQEIS